MMFLSNCCRLSVSNDLKVDSERDLRDIGAGRIDVHALNKVILCLIMENVHL